MVIYKFITTLLFTLVLFQAPVYSQGVASIPFKNSRLPSDDLLYQGRVLRSDEAYQLIKDGFDLSTLNPMNSSVWEDQKTLSNESLDEVGFQEGGSVDYKGALQSDSGLFRFNAVYGQKTMIVHLHKTLHTMLLRKNILRLLGYKIPPMKWVKKITIKFSSAQEMKDTLESSIPRGTAGASSRWTTNVDEKTFTATMHDVVITVPSSEDHNNYSMGAPPKMLTTRTMRSLIIPYGLLDLGESVNKFEWTVGRVSNNEILLPHFTRSTFATTMDDAKWMLKRLSTLTQEELSKAVELSHFPADVSPLVLEKLLSRRNALLKVFKQKIPEFPVNFKVSSGSRLVEGKLTAIMVKGKLSKEQWDGYASNFAHGDPESPFKDFHWYALAKLQAIGIDNIIAEANKQLVIFNPNKERTDFILKQFYKGLDHFVKTGEFLTFPVKTWFSPIANINVSTSRDVVIGNYLGTDNLVQIADTIGWSIKLGGHLGIENLEMIPTLAVTATASLNKNWTHIKPLRNLKDALKEPYKNIMVPLMKWQLTKELNKLKKLENSKKPEVDWNLKEDNSALSQIIEHINKNLGKGESILYTETITPSSGAQGSTGAYFSPVDVKLQATVNANVIRRVQIFRKDETTIQVYDDIGHGKGWSFDMSIEKFIPIIRLGWRGQKGDFSVRVHNVNINPEVKENPKLFQSAYAISEFLHTGSSELLESIEKPHSIKADFQDKSSRLALLAWRMKKLKTQTFFDIESRDGLKGKYVSFTDEMQTGWNWEAFAKDFINIGLGKIFDGLEWSSNAFQNPAETIGGMGTTTSVRFEAAIDEDGSQQERFMRLTDRWEGWSAKVDKVQNKMREANEKFGFLIFDDLTLGNTKKLKLFNVSVNLNLYEDGIQRLATIPQDKLIVLENAYEVKRGYAKHGCAEDQIQERRLSSGKTVLSCGSFNTIIFTNRECQSAMADGSDQNKVDRCLTKFLRVLYDKIDYKDISVLLGKDNIFVNGSVNGFRNGDETLNDSIPSNTDGSIGGNFWNGPFEYIQRVLGVQSGEFSGFWLRDRL